MSWFPWDGTRDLRSTTGWSTDYGYRNVLSPAKVLERIAPLLQHLTEYDKLRKQYEDCGMSAAELSRMTEFMSKTIQLKSPRGGGLAISLVHPQSVRMALDEIGDYDLHLAVRFRESRVPVYYLCRTHSDFWSDYRLILEDLYRSPDYPMFDERFIKLMRYGHEKYHLRLALFRDATKRAFGEDEEPSSKYIDRVLRWTGEHVFQAAWHEDQRLAFAAAAAFDIPRFREVIEFLYLCLSGDLWRLRNLADETMLTFFQKVYAQPAIGRLLVHLPDMDEKTIAAIPETALGMYADLSRSFSRLLHTEVPWRSEGRRMPLFKLVFANVNRLDEVSQALGRVPEICDAAERLNEEIAGIVVGLVAA